LAQVPFDASAFISALIRVILCTFAGAMARELAILGLLWILLQATLAHENSCTATGDVACPEAAKQSRTLLAVKHSVSKSNDTETSSEGCCLVKVTVDALYFTKSAGAIKKGSCTRIKGSQPFTQTNNPEPSTNTRSFDKDRNKNSRGKILKNWKRGRYTSFFYFSDRTFWGGSLRHFYARGGESGQCLMKKDYFTEIKIETNRGYGIEEIPCEDLKDQRGKDCSKLGQCSVICGGAWRKAKLYYRWERSNKCGSPFENNRDGEYGFPGQRRRHHNYLAACKR